MKIIHEATKKQLIIGIIAHIFVFTFVLITLYAIMEVYPIIFNIEDPIYAVILAYAIINALFLLSVQLGFQISNFGKIRRPPFLLSYYFMFDEDKELDREALDPTKSRLAVLILIFLLAGGYVILPAFYIYGIVLIISKIPRLKLGFDIILDYPLRFLRLIPPLFLVLIIFIIISVILIELKHR